MRYRMLYPCLLILAANAPMGCTTTAEQKSSDKAPEIEWSHCVREIPPGLDTPTSPYPRTRDYPWMSRNEWCTRFTQILNDPARADAQLGFMGDSITQMWPEDLWVQKFGSYKPIRMGIGGDRTQTLLWRIENGELKGLSLKNIVLLIGTNNLYAGDSADGVKKGIKITIDQIRKYLPQVRIVLMAIFPREQSPTHPLRTKISDTNQLLSAMAANWKVEFVDIGAQLVEKDGSIDKEMMSDYVHLSPKAYNIWADAVTKILRK